MAEQKYFKGDIITYKLNKSRRVGFILDHYFLSGVYRVSAEDREKTSEAVMVSEKDIIAKYINQDVSK